MPDKPDGLPAPDALRGMFEVPLQTSIGLENLFDAQNTLFHLLRSLPAGQSITIADCGAVDWAHTDRTLLEEGIRANREALAAGHHMRIIDQLTDTYRPWELMFQWLPMYLQPNVETFFYRNPKPMPLRQNLMVIHGHAALVMSSTAAAPGLVIASLYRDPEYVRLFDAVIDTMLADSHPMMQVMDAGQLAPFLQMIEEHVRSRRVLYMINRLPTFRNMPPALLDEILRGNGVQGALYERCTAAGRQTPRRVDAVNAARSMTWTPWRPQQRGNMWWAPTCPRSPDGRSACRAASSCASWRICANGCAATIIPWWSILSPGWGLRSRPAT